MHSMGTCALSMRYLRNNKLLVFVTFCRGNVAKTASSINEYTAVTYITKIIFNVVESHG